MMVPTENPQVASINVGQSLPPGEPLLGKLSTENDALKALTQRNEKPIVNPETKPSSEQLNARIETGFLAMRKVLNQETVETDHQMILMAQKATGEKTLYYTVGGSEELRPVEDVTADVKNKLIELKRAQEQDEITTITNSLLADCHELDWRGELDEFTRQLDGNERGALKDLTRQTASTRLADVFNFDESTKIPEALRLAQEAMGVHSHLYQTVERTNFNEKHPGGPKLVEQANLALVTQQEIMKVSYGAVAEVIKRHPDWASAVWKGFSEHIIPWIIKSLAETV